MSPGRGGTRLLRDLLAPRRRALGMLALWSAVEASPTFVSGLLVAAALDRGFLASRPFVGVGWLLCFAATELMAAFATRRLYPHLAQTIEGLRDDLLTAVTTACVYHAISHAEPADGSGVAQITQQVETARDLLSSVLRNARLFLSIVVAVGGLALLAPPLALLVVPMFLLALVGFLWFLRVLLTRQRAVVLAGEQVTRAAHPVIEGVRDVAACGAEERASDTVGEAIQVEAAAVRAFARARMIRGLILALGVHFPLLVVLAASPGLVQHGYVTIGAVGGAVIYLAQQLGPALRFLIDAGGTWLLTLGVVLGRLSEVTSIQPPMSSGTRHLAPGPLNLHVDNITFAYSPHADPVIKNLRLDIPAGTHLAVVGPSGAGKSTLANLLAGILAPQHGHVLLNGLPIQQIDEQGLRRTITLIPQEAYVFAGTVWDNLTYLQPETSTEELDRIVALLGLEQVVTRLGGYPGDIAPGGEGLSAGERQLLALARVFLSPASLIILDEATCHLDPVAEAQVEAAFAARHGTLIVIAHRISSAMRANTILVMDGVETTLGRHDDLITQNTLYADLVGYWNHEAANRDLSEPIETRR